MMQMDGLAPPPMPAATAARLQRLDERPPRLAVDNLSKIFPTPAGPLTALQSIEHVIRPREFCCVIGPSGCGKSTLIRILAGLEYATAGSVLVDGKPVSGPGPDRGMVFQAYTLFPWLSVLRNVMFGILEQGASPTRAESEARQWLEMVGLGDSARSYPHQLSGGMKQRVAIARALAAGPRVLLMDEPFSALDPRTRGQMQQHLMQIHERVDLTVAFITHDLDEAALLADRILILHPRPGRVAGVVDVPLPRERPPSIQHSAEFLAFRSHLDRLVHGDETEDEDDAPLPLPNMVPVERR